MKESIFDQISLEWWDKNGPMKMLHSMNETRMLFIKERIINKDQKLGSFKEILEKKLILDLGCGGGILSETLAEEGANILAIDQSKKLINEAKKRAKSKNLKIDYQCQSIKYLKGKRAKFDIILCMEVVEHVESLEIFMEETCRKVKKDGLLFLATINRTLYSLLAQKIGAEYILNWLPRGTHDWRRFVKPIELRDLVKKNDFESRNVQGVGANIFKRALHLSDAVSGNYMMACKRV